MVSIEILLLSLDQLDAKIKKSQWRGDIALLRKLYALHKSTRAEIISLLGPQIENEFPYVSIRPGYNKGLPTE